MTTVAEVEVEATARASAFAGTVTDPGGEAAEGDAWPVCLRGAIAEGFSLTVYEGGSVEDLDACAERLGVVAIYVLAGGEWVPYIPGGPAFVNATFRELFPNSVPAATPLVAASDGSPGGGLGQDGTAGN